MNEIIHLKREFGYHKALDLHVMNRTWSTPYLFKSLEHSHMKDNIDIVS